MFHPMDTEGKSYSRLMSDDNLIWSSNELSTGQMFITVDTNETFPDIRQAVVVDNDSYVLSDGSQIPVNGQNIIYLDGLSPLNYTAAESSPYEIQGKISFVDSTQTQGLFCGECSMKLESPVDFFQHWVSNHCQLEQPSQNVDTPPAQILSDSTMGGTGPSLTMERCNRCNHIFVEGTNRYKNHLMGCEKQATVSDVVLAQNQVPSSTVPTCTPPNRVKRVKVGGQGSQGVSHGYSSNPKYVCGVCSEGVKTVTAFFLHWLESHQGLRDILQEVWQCRGCSGSKLFPDCLSLSEHAKSHQTIRPKEFQVHCCPFPQCQARVDSEDSLGLHLGHFHRQIMPGERVQCPSCSSIFSGTNEAYLHFRDEHLITCGFCLCDISKDSSRDHFLNVHQCEVVWNRNLSLQKVSKSPQVSRICTGVNQGPMRLANGAIAKMKPLVLSKSSSTSKNDQKEANEERGFKCSKCTQVFTNIKVMEKHFHSNHMFPCKFCKKVMDKDEYGIHLRQHLASERRKTLPASASITTTTSLTQDNEQTLLQYQSSVL